jgi:hypothetical protein
MIGFLWLNTYWFPAFTFLGGLISVLWLISKGVDVIEHIGSRIARRWYSSDSMHSSNFD